MDTTVRDITSEELALLSDTVCCLTDNQIGRDIREVVGEKIMRLLRADFFASFTWDDQRGRFDHPYTINQDLDNIRRYRDWYQFRDPLSHKLRALKRVALVREVISREELNKTEFFNEFLSHDGLYDGINLFMFDGVRALGDMRIWRSRGRPAFDERELVLLNTLLPYLRNALLRQRDSGVVGLTNRERDVAQLVTRGCTDQDIARILGISFSTVRTHLNHCLDKLSCANRAELTAFLLRQKH